MLANPTTWPATSVAKQEPWNWANAIFVSIVTQSRVRVVREVVVLMLIVERTGYDSNRK